MSADTDADISLPEVPRAVAEALPEANVARVTAAVLAVVGVGAIGAAAVLAWVADPLAMDPRICPQVSGFGCRAALFVRLETLARPLLYTGAGAVMAAAVVWEVFGHGD